MNTPDFNIKFIASKYRIGKKIDEGAFGKIYKGVNIKQGTCDSEYAIKIESMKTQHPQLIAQCKLYNMLHSDINASQRGIPRIFCCGSQQQYNYLVMDLMGPSLQSLLNLSSKRFTLKTVLMLIDQMISRIQYLHQRSLLHRDIKPDNFCMGLNKDKNKLFVLDLGLAKRFQQPNGKHIPWRTGKSLTGTARYASINTHEGGQQSRRDDMESIGYVALYCLKGSLPWQCQKNGNKVDRYQRIKQTKINTSVQSLCKGQPQQFARYLNIVKKLRFQQKPNYKQLRQLFSNLFTKNNYVLDYQYDWCKAKDPKLDFLHMSKSK